MNIKELIQNGATIEFPYTTSASGMVSMFRIIGLDSIILVQHPVSGTTDFSHDNIDDAVKMFTEHVFSADNLMYRNNKVNHTLNPND